MKRVPGTAFWSVIAICIAFSAFQWRTTAAAAAQDRTFNRDTPKNPGGEKRIALVIGNETYRKARRLENPVNDARAMARALREVGFEVLGPTGNGYHDLDQRQMIAAMKEFGRRLRANPGVGLFYFAGHGVEANDTNYLIPTDADPEDETDLKYQAVDVHDILEQFVGNRLNIVILDACRDNPFQRSFHRERGGGDGLKQVDAPTGTLIAYATAPRRTASDGKGGNGLYTEQLLEAIRIPGLSIEQVFKRVRVRVQERSRGAQVPWENSSLNGDFYFVSATGATAANPELSPTVKRERRFGTLVVTAAQSGTEIFIDGKLQGVAESPGEKFRIENLAAGQKVEIRGRIRGRKPLVKRVEIESGREVRVELAFEPAKPFTNQVGMVFIPVAAGEFRMGELEEAGQSHEKPVHRVVISERFWMGKFEVTRTQWASVMGSSPGDSTDCPDCPVTQVSWNDCREFVARLNAMGDGRVYALPTEAEWEYACRAGTQDGYLGDALVPFAWYSATEAEIGQGGLHPVGQKKANPWGLHDVYGNAWEWVADRFGDGYYSKSSLTDPTGPETGEARVMRGGSFRHNAYGCRAAMRFWLEPSRRESDVGLRVLARIAPK